MTDDAFEELRSISLELLGSEGETAARSRFIRFLDSDRASDELVTVVDSLAIRIGLFPYVSPNVTQLGPSDALALAYHSPRALHRRGFTFHAEQQRVYERLMDGESVILSAPTSFGKSAVVDALILARRWSNIVLIVPTIALIDETRRRVAGLRSGYTIVSHPVQSRSDRNVYVLTQERFLELDPAPEVGLFVIDEFYKLGNGDGVDQRRAALNIAWRQLKATGAQFYLIGPNVASIDEAVEPAIKDLLVVSDFNTVVVDVEDRSHIPEDARLSDLKNFLDSEANGPSLVFVSAPSRAVAAARELASGAADPFVLEMSAWLKEHYDPEWAVAVALEGGVGTHTGPMPRSIQRAMVRLFSMRKIDVLVCTTTLIEGVNTVARNVVILDKHIDRKPIDFFTFSNIRGRAGRMLKHFVGRVIAYNEPPAREESMIDLPIESQSVAASLAMLVQLADEDLTDESVERLRDVTNQSDLDLAVIRKNKGVDPERQVNAARYLRQAPRSSFDRLSWTGVPNYEEMLETIQVGYDHLLEGKERRGANPKSLVSRMWAVRNASGSIPEMVERQWEWRHPGQTRSDVVDDVLSFQRNWMGFTIPSLLRTVNSIQSAVAADRPGARRGNYEYALREIESLYLPPFIADLEEYGLPVPIALKLHELGLRGETIEQVTLKLADMAVDQQVLANLSVVERWFLSDVASGLGYGSRAADAAREELLAEFHEFYLAAGLDDIVRDESPADGSAGSWLESVSMVSTEEAVEQYFGDGQTESQKLKLVEDLETESGLWVLRSDWDRHRSELLS